MKREVEILKRYNRWVKHYNKALLEMDLEAMAYYAFMLNAVSAAVRASGDARLHDYFDRNAGKTN